MLKILKLNLESVFADKINPGDFLVSVNNNEINDYLDFQFFTAFIKKKFVFDFLLKNKKTIKIRISAELFHGNHGMEFEDFKVSRCGNKCIFCFCDQHPQSARPTLFFKDEDYRLSFLYGNYITLSNTKKNDCNKIFKMRLSPLYISVHTTNDVNRRKILGINYKFRIIDKLKFFAENRIQFHTQIVLIPNFNDNDLLKTIDDLSALHPLLLSIAVVPVGITKYRDNLPALKPVDKTLALKILNSVELKQKEFKKNFGQPLVFLSDEFYILAGKELPDYKHYGEFPQIENGVGFISVFLRDFKRNIKRYSKKFDISKKYFIITGEITNLFFKEIINLLRTVYNIKIQALHIKNKYFGGNVSVTGLLSGRDIIAELTKLKKNKKIDKNTIIFLPDVTLRNEKDLFIDNTNIDDILKKFPIKIISSDAVGLLKNI